MTETCCVQEPEEESQVSWLDYRPVSMADAFDAIQMHAEGYPWVPLGNFMLDFFRNFPDHRLDLVSDPLRIQVSNEDNDELHRWAVFCAASVEYLCRLYLLECPAWVHDPAYDRLCEPWYFAPMALKKERVRLQAEQTTPIEFTQRNIYCGDRVWIDKHAEAQVFQRKQMSA